MVCAPTKWCLNESPRSHLFKTSIRSKIPSLHLEIGCDKDIDVNFFVRFQVRPAARRCQNPLYFPYRTSKPFVFCLSNDQNPLYFPYWEADSLWTSAWMAAANASRSFCGRISMNTQPFQTNSRTRSIRNECPIDPARVWASPRKLSHILFT